MNQPTLGLLEKLRPPIGFSTEAALGTTYSADLLACMAVLTTLDGGEGEQVRYGRVEAYRAVDRLRDRVRIYHHLGCLSRRDGRKYPSLALLDKVLVPFTVPGPGSFHPKVWLVRQVDATGRSRFLLVVSSRNVTTSTDWDFGVVIQGNVGGSGVALPRVRAFTEYIQKLGGDVPHLQRLGDLDAVRWELPRGVKEVWFDFQEATDGPRRLHDVWGTFPRRPSDLLLLSPFIDGRMIAESAKRWGTVGKRRLVAGTEGLATVAVGSHRDELQTLSPRQLVAATGLETGPGQGAAGEPAEEEDEPTRALHAKVIAIGDGRKATLVVGSNNLTGNGWCGGSAEAFLRLRGEVSLTEALWQWADAHAIQFDFPEVGTPAPARPLLDEEAERLRSTRFRLEESGPDVDSVLSLVEPAPLALAEGVVLEVCRYTTPAQSVSFPASVTAVSLPGCKRALRTRFIVCSLRHGDEQISWTTQAEVVPPLDDLRDRELVAHLLSPRDFLAYLQSLRSAESVAGPAEGDDSDDQLESSVERATRADASFSLEGLLRQLSEEPEAFTEMNRVVQRYGELVASSSLRDEKERRRFAEFMAAWAVTREAFTP